VLPVEDRWLDGSSPWLAAHPLAAALAPHLFATALAAPASGDGAGEAAALTVDDVRREAAVVRGALTAHAAGVTTGEMLLLKRTSKQWGGGEY
jgi:hypothetical protein